MDPISWLALVVLLVLVALAVMVFAELVTLPKKIATKRSSPQVDAINMLSWLGLLFTGGVGWIVAMVWACMRPSEAAAAGKEA